MPFCPLGQGGGLHLWHYFVAASVLCVRGDAEHGGCASPFLVLGELGTSPLSLQAALRLLFRFYNEKLQISSWHFLGLLLAPHFLLPKGSSHLPQVVPSCFLCPAPLWVLVLPTPQLCGEGRTPLARMAGPGRMQTVWQSAG